MAKLNFKYGTMNSGKTLDLVKTIFNYEENGREIILLKSVIDTKGSDEVVSRTGFSRKIDSFVQQDDNIIDIIVDLYNPNVKCVFVDEAQLLTPKQVKELFVLTKAMDIDVICYGLRNNFKMQAFAGSAALLELAEKLEELPTLCTYCDETARYVGRKYYGEFVTEGEEIVIDGKDDHTKYVPMCGKCYVKKVNKLDLSCKKIIQEEKIDLEKVKKIGRYC